MMPEYGRTIGKVCWTAVHSMQARLPDGTNRYIWGWCPTRAGNDNGNVGDVEPEWAGNLVAQRLIQHEDGTLTLGVPDAIDRKYTSAQEVKVMAKDGNVTEAVKPIRWPKELPLSSTG